MSDTEGDLSRATPSHHLAAVWFADLVGYTARRDPRFQRVLQRMDADLSRMRERAPKERP